MVKIIKINPKKPQNEIIKKAALILKNGGLIVMPTETVYGIVANAYDAKAAGKIFRVKRRSRKKPFIVLVSKKSDIRKIAKNIPPEAEILTRKFWPGPLTLVLERKKSIPKVIAGGKNTIAVRMSPHPVVLSIIRALGSPITAPSANLSGKSPHKTVEGVINELGKKPEISLILDAGKTLGGISTILDLTKKPFKILRTGKISKKSLKIIKSY